MRALYHAGLCAALCWTCVAPGRLGAAVTNYNEDFLNNTGSDQDTLSVYLTGDWHNSITVSYNPFGVGTSYSATYDSGTDLTTISFTGPVPVLAGHVGHIGYGLVGGAGAQHGLGSPSTNGKSWGVGAALVYEPAITLSLSAIAQPATAPEPALAPAPVQWVVLFASFQAPASAGASSSALEHEWAEFPVPGAAFPVDAFFSNEASQPMTVTLSQVGYLLSSSEVPLVNLNATDLPGSGFTPLGVPDGTTLTPGAFVSVILVPEPASGLGLAAIASLALILRRRR